MTELCEICGWVKNSPNCVHNKTGQTVNFQDDNISNMGGGFEQQKEEMQNMAGGIQKLMKWVVSFFPEQHQLPPETKEVKVFKLVIAKQLFKETKTMLFFSASSTILTGLILMSTIGLKHPNIFLNMLKSFAVLSGILSNIILTYILLKKRDYLKTKYGLQ